MSLTRFLPLLVAVAFLCTFGPFVAAAEERPGDLLESPDSSERSDHRPAMFKDARQALAIARAQGRDGVVLLIAAVEGGAESVARRAVELGGHVGYRDDVVDYIRVRVPIDRATELSEFDRVVAATVDVDDNYPSRLSANGFSGWYGSLDTSVRSGPLRPMTGMEDGARTGTRTALAPRRTGVPLPVAQEGDAQEQEAEWPPTLSDYPLRHPYSPLEDLDAAEFRERHPTWDGRGVTIALLDGNYDLLLPEFQTAYTLNGSPVPKTADFLNASDPLVDFELNPQWVDMGTTVTSSGGRATFQGKTFTVPEDGSYRIGFFSERRFNNPGNAAYIDQDIDRNGNPKGDDGLFGVLWDEATNDVWVDTDRDLSFADEEAMTDYIERQEIGVFGQDDPTTPIRESIGFTVQTDPENEFISINVGVYQHASGILGAVIGNPEPEGVLEGVAPGARLVSIHWGLSSHGMVEGLIMAFKHPLVDLIVLEQSVAIMSMPYSLADARHPISIIIQRLIDTYDKLLFVPGNNLAAFGLVAEDGLAPGAVSVGGYQSRESYRLNAGFVPEHYDNLHWGALSHGPSTAGALKPDLLAPSGQMSTDPGYREGAVSAGLFDLAPGYGIGGGTSTAAPTAAGAAALVVSAAKQSGVKYDAKRLKAALTGSARYIQRLPAHEQGNGLIQVAAAYELLKELEATELVTIEVEAPVKNKLSHLFETPHEGYGLYEREGWSLGERGERTITLTRTSGQAEPMTFALEWVGNDGTFSSPASVTLPLNEAVGVPVKIVAREEGAHSAILSLEHPSLPRPAHRVLNTIVVPYRFTAENGYSMTKEVTPPLPGDLSLFVKVPEGVSALTVSTSSNTVRLGLQGPARDVRWRARCANDDMETMCSFGHPTPGVWEINLASMAGRTFDPTAPVPLENSPVRVTATIVDVDIEATPNSLSGAVGGTRPLSLTLTNRLGKVVAEAASVELGSARWEHATIAQGEQHAYEIIVPKGATSLRAEIGDVSDADADLDLYLLECAEAQTPRDQPPPEEVEEGNKAPMMPDPLCGPRAKVDDPDRDGVVEVPSPVPGRWVVVVDAFVVPDGQTEYQYFDVFTHPRFGAVTVADIVEERRPSATWTAKANAWITALRDAPRQLHARLVARSPAIVQPIRVAEGFDASGISEWHIPIGFLDLRIEE